MKLTKLQIQDLEHKIYVALDTDIEERESHETDEFFHQILNIISTGRLEGLKTNQIEWLLCEAENLNSIFMHNYRADNSNIGDVVSSTNLIKKLENA